MLGQCWRAYITGLIWSTLSRLIVESEEGRDRPEHPQRRPDRRRLRHGHAIAIIAGPFAWVRTTESALRPLTMAGVALNLVSDVDNPRVKSAFGSARYLLTPTVPGVKMELACEAGEGAVRLRGLTILGPLGDPQIPDPDNAGEGKTSRRSLLSMRPLKDPSIPCDPWLRFTRRSSRDLR
ncbi:hypothetical protein EV643_13849 [Kribbella sp. VKM Ac-2527]|uniref:Uncharacterized protein n=1 Tax=Kribbella caucasensis TaxID=2512215 RepID=A0A4R6J7W7_9ACTN|nr:hypothetical protein EV643_13849 [Kribbella sp. VKM Ac-2527]